MSLKFCMISCGGFARLCHGPVQRRRAARDSSLLLAACCDPDPERARKYQNLFGFQHCYSDTGQMLAAERPDAVAMATPPAATAETAALVLGQGIPLFLEKPPGLTLAELRRLIALAGTNETRTQVGFNRRYMPVLRKAIEHLGRDRAPAGVARIDYDMIRCNRWNEDFSTTAIHAIDMLRFLARSPIARSELRFQSQADQGRSAANVRLEGETAAGTRIALNILPTAGRNAESIRIHGVDWSLEIHVPASPLADDHGALELWSAGKRILAFDDGSIEMIERMGICAEFDAFLEAIARDVPVTPRLSECVQQVALMEAIRNGRDGTITVPLG